jgi:hypothetical protein
MALVFDLHCDTPRNIAKGKFNHIEPEKLYKQSYLGAVFAQLPMWRRKRRFRLSVLIRI